MIRKETMELQFLTYLYLQKVRIDKVETTLGNQKGLYHHVLAVLAVLEVLEAPVAREDLEEPEARGEDQVALALEILKETWVKLLIHKR